MTVSGLAAALALSVALEGGCGVASVIGHQRFTVDLDTEVTTSYSLDGQATDVCPLISS